MVQPRKQITGNSAGPLSQHGCSVTQPVLGSHALYATASATLVSARRGKSLRRREVLRHGKASFATRRLVRSVNVRVWPRDDVRTVV
jgi:hypothetical protein